MIQVALRNDGRGVDVLSGAFFTTLLGLDLWLERGVGRCIAGWVRLLFLAHCEQRSNVKMNVQNQHFPSINNRFHCTLLTSPYRNPSPRRILASLTVVPADTANAIASVDLSGSWPASVLVLRGADIDWGGERWPVGRRNWTVARGRYRPSRERAARAP